MAKKRIALYALQFKYVSFVSVAMRYVSYLERDKRTQIQLVSIYIPEVYGRDLDIVSFIFADAIFSFTSSRKSL